MLDGLPLVDRNGVLGLDPEPFVHRRLLGQGSENSTVLLHDAFSRGHDPAMTEVLVRGSLSDIVRRLFRCPGRRPCVAAFFRDARRMVAFSIHRLYPSQHKSESHYGDRSTACLRATWSLDGSFTPTRPLSLRHHLSRQRTVGVDVG